MTKKIIQPGMLVLVKLSPDAQKAAIGKFHNKIVWIGCPNKIFVGEITWQLHDSEKDSYWDWFFERELELINKEQYDTAGNEGNLSS